MPYTVNFGSDIGLYEQEPAAPPKQKMHDPWEGYDSAFMGKERVETPFEVPLQLGGDTPRPFKKHHKLYFPVKTEK